MTKNKKLTLIYVGIAFLFAFVAIFMGLTVGVKSTYTVEGVSSASKEFKLFDLMFKSFSEFKGSELEVKRQGVAIVGFVALLISILTLATTGILNLVKKSNKKINLGLLSTSLILLVASGIIILCIKPIIGWNDEHTLEGIVSLKNKLGAGAIVWSVFSMISMVFTALAIDRVRKDNVQAA